MDNRPIGVFDSGIGGFTIFDEIRKELPGENIIYFGDLARVPYGSKTKENIIKFSIEICDFLMAKNVKAIVVACNTASSNAIEILSKRYSVPVIGVVKPGAELAIRESEDSKIGLIGTKSTISSGAYSKFLGEKLIMSKACPLFVPLVEEDYLDTEAARYIAKDYLLEFEDKVDSLILGCTHYPHIEGLIKETLGEKIKIINPAKEVVRVLRESVDISGKSLGEYEIYSSDDSKGMIKYLKRLKTYKYEVMTLGS
ncbi:MAG: glutamate racemase [Clostridia bacterium]|jgi:glutamate racemase|nr:glutamate racemase [Clostridia bacterium]